MPESNNRYVGTNSKKKKKSVYKNRQYQDGRFLQLQIKILRLSLADLTFCLAPSDKDF